MHKIVNIQFLRAFAALSVVMYHTAAHYFVIGGAKTGTLFSFMSHIGYAGVDIFFVISGYIMWISTQSKGGKHHVLQFIYSRLTRIYPLYWSLFFIQIILLYYSIGLADFKLIDSFFLTNSSSSTLILAVAWTLQYELYFYLFFSLLLFFQKKQRFYIQLSTFIFILVIQLYAIYYLNIYTIPSFTSASSFYTFWTSPFCVEFLLGAFIGYFFEFFRIKYISRV